MTQNKNSEVAYLLNSLALYRAKYLKLLTGSSTGEELTHCEKAIQFYLSAISMVTGVQKPDKHFTFSFKSLFRKLTHLTKSKPNSYGLQTI